MRLPLSRAARPFIGVERGPSWVRLVEVLPTGTGFRVSNFALVEHMEDAESFASAQVAEVLKSKGFQAKAAVLGLGGEGVNLRLLPLPKLKKSELQVVLEREVTLETGAPPQDVAYDYRVLGEIREGAVAHTLVLLADAPVAKVELELGFIGNCGLRLEAAIPVPLALAALLRTLDPTRCTSAIVYLGEKTAHLVVVSRGQFRFHREIALERSSGVGEGGLDADYLGGEVQRSFLYVQQLLRGEERVEGVQLCGVGALPQIAGALSPVLRVPVVPCDLSGLFDLAPLGGDLREFQAMAPQLAVPLGLAFAARECPNLLPKRLVRQRRARVQAVAGAVAALVLGLLLLFAFVTVSGHNAQARERVAALATELGTLKPRQQELERGRTQRQHYQARSLFLERMRHHALFFAGLLDVLAAKIPETATLQSFEVTRGAEGWQLRVEGEVRAQNLGAALAILDEFQKQIQRQPFLANLEVKLTEERNPQEGQSGMGDKSRAGFTITADLTLKSLLVCAPPAIKGGKV